MGGDTLASPARLGSSATIVTVLSRLWTSRAWRPVRLWASGVGCGLLVALSVPPFGWWPLSWLGFAALALLMPGLPAGDRLALGFGAGLGQFVLGLWWVQEFSIPGCIALMVVSSVYVAAAVALVPARRPTLVPVALPSLLVLSEWLRDRWPLGGFPLGGVALGQATSPLVAGARLGGGLLVMGDTVLAGLAVAQLARIGERIVRDRSAGIPRGQLLGFTSIAFLAAVIPVGGLLSPTGAGGRLPAMRVALVQGGGPRGTRAINTDPQIVFDRHLDASAPLQPPIDLVVWPEGVLQSHLNFQTGADALQIAELAQRLHSTVIAGVEQDVGNTRYLNEIVAWSPTGQVVATYVKNHRVPFGEYVPWRSFLSHFFDLADVPLDAIPGHSPGFINTPAGPLGVMISYEVFFDERARGGVRNGGQVLVVPTNTASYRSSQVPTQELAADKLRAWETGRWLVQVTPTGYTAVVSPTGRVVERTTLGSSQVLTATVDREGGRTIYVDIGDGPVAIVALLCVVGVMVFGYWPRGRRRGPGQSQVP